MSNNPICDCGNQSEHIVISPTLEYFYCRECKNEVKVEDKVELEGTRGATQEEMNFITEAIKQMKEVYRLNVDNLNKDLGGLEIDIWDETADLDDE